MAASRPEVGDVGATRSKIAAMVRWEVLLVAVSWSSQRMAHAGRDGRRAPRTRTGIARGR